MDLNPCELLDEPVLADLKLRPHQPHTESYTRSCRYGTTRDAADRTPAVLGLTTVVRHSAAANTIADAQRLVEVYRRAWKPTVTELDVAGRKVYRLAGDRPDPQRPWETNAYCALVFAVDATSSIEFSITDASPDLRCGEGDLPAALARRMPATDERSVPPRSNRPPDAFTIDLCGLVGADRRRQLGLTDTTMVDGPPITDGTRRCRMVSAGGPPGHLVGLTVAVDGHDPRGSTVEDENRRPANHREVESRPVYQSTDVSAFGASCSDRIRVTGGQMFEVLALINAQDPAPACRIVEELTTVIEPSLPLLVVEPTPPT